MTKTTSLTVMLVSAMFVERILKSERVGGWGEIFRKMRRGEVSKIWNAHSQFCERHLELISELSSDPKSACWSVELTPGIWRTITEHHKLIAHTYIFLNENDPWHSTCLCCWSANLLSSKRMRSRSPTISSYPGKNIKTAPRDGKQETHTSGWSS